MVSVAIVDYGVGNLRSIKKALEKTGATSIITSSSSDIKKGGCDSPTWRGLFQECDAKPRPNASIAT
jgi:glutamine amidotransferase